MKTWHQTKEVQPPVGVELIGYDKEWVDEDFTPNGQRMFSAYETECDEENMAQTAVWNNCMEEYVGTKSKLPSHWKHQDSSPKES